MPWALHCPLLQTTGRRKSAAKQIVHRLCLGIGRVVAESGGYRQRQVAHYVGIAGIFEVTGVSLHAYLVAGIYRQHKSRPYRLAGTVGGIQPRRITATAVTVIHVQMARIHIFEGAVRRFQVGKKGMFHGLGRSHRPHIAQVIGKLINIR